MKVRRTKCWCGSVGEQKWDREESGEKGVGENNGRALVLLRALTKSV